MDVEETFVPCLEAAALCHSCFPLVLLSIEVLFDELDGAGQRSTSLCQQKVSYPVVSLGRWFLVTAESMLRVREFSFYHTIECCDYITSV